MRPKIFLSVLAVSFLIYAMPLCGLLPDEIPGIAYPRLALFAGVSGAVVVECRIKPNGNVEWAKAVSGHPMLREAATAAAMGWHFKRSQNDLDGDSFQITFEFRLAGSCADHRCSEKFLLRYPERVIVTAEIPGIQP